ncbi:MAG TPA: group III truncated hemoglobin [Candidatus Sulfotelmatobacter sp.]|jgi:hemoglobin|nr:group III truncated hemoglobin [Candidatus Sulfotelmatobacter sp.]
MTDAVPEAEVKPTEEQIARLVRLFYERARQEERLGPLFARMVSDWEGHFVIVQDFWSHILLGTGRYKGSPFAPHMQMPIELEHFDRWLGLFRQTAVEVLPPDAAKLAIARAEHMTKSFRMGLFPWIGPNGQPLRHKPKV